MGIYIKGMEMPGSCFECPMRRKVDPDTIKCLATGNLIEETFAGTIQTRNGGSCPLVEVPPHGRLIDADELPRFGGRKGLIHSADVDNAPTIIPAESEG